MIKRIIRGIIRRYKEYKPFIIRPKCMIFLFGSPGHGNMGDQAQTYCIQKWLEKNYPRYGLKIYTLCQSTEKTFSLLRRFIRKNDMLICHSGYHITDLYDERLPYMELAKRFKDHRIIVFPQTVFFNDKSKLQENAEVFNNHGNLLLMCRDEVSYKAAQQYFTSCKLLLMPDIVTSLIGTYDYTKIRKGVLFCIRNDKEAFYPKKDLDSLKERFEASNIMTHVTDTTLQLDTHYIIQNREKRLLELFEEYSRYQVVITDRYHGTIFSLIACTPVVVIGSTDHKLSSGVKWFPEEFSEYVSFANSLDEAYLKATDVIARQKSVPALPSYFKVNYYDRLKQRIEEVFSSPE